jgi:hypothetical protein
MWMFVLLGTALFVGLGSRRSAARERAILLGAALLMLSYVAVTKHLL